MEKSWKKNAAVFLGSQAVSLFGSALVQYAITWHINLTTGSATYMTLAVVFGFAPTFLLAPFAGVWADRYNRRVLTVVADGCIAVATLILAFVVWSGNNSLVPMFIALTIRSLGAAVQGPCVTAILPSVVPEEHLTKANGINSSIQASITLLSPMLAALLIKQVPFFYIFFIDVGTAAIAIFVLLFVFKYRHQKRADKEKNDYFGELKLGVRYIGARPFLKYFFVGLFISNFLVVPLAFLTPLQITRNYGASTDYLMWLEIAFSAGMIAGGLIIAAWGGLKNRVHTMLLSNCVLAAVSIAVGFKMPLVPYLVIMLVCGLFMPAFNTPATVILQERIDDEYRGRVFSVLTMLNYASLPLGMLIFGPLGDVVAIEYLLIVTGILIFAAGIFILTRKPVLEAGLPMLSPETAAAEFEIEPESEPEQ